MKSKAGYIYILTNKINHVLYVGECVDLIDRVYEHKEKLVKGFTAKYNVNKLVYYEVYETLVEAIQREKHLKNWKREWKIELIKKMNPMFKDLYQDLL